MALRNIGIRFDDRPLFEGIEFVVRRNDRSSRPRARSAGSQPSVTPTRFHVEDTRDLRAQRFGNTVSQIRCAEDRRRTKCLGLPRELPLDDFIVIHDLPALPVRGASPQRSSATRFK